MVLTQQAARQSWLSDWLRSQVDRLQLWYKKNSGPLPDFENEAEREAWEKYDRLQW